MPPPSQSLMCVWGDRAPPSVEPVPRPLGQLCSVGLELGACSSTCFAVPTTLPVTQPVPILVSKSSGPPPPQSLPGPSWSWLSPERLSAPLPKGRPCRGLQLLTAVSSGADDGLQFPQRLQETLPSAPGPKPSCDSPHLTDEKTGSLRVKELIKVP